MTFNLVLLSELLTLVLLVGSSKLSLASGIVFLVFPELSALSYNVFARPAGAWANAGAKLVITPTVAATVGVLIARNLAFGAVSVALCIVSGMLLLRLLRSSVAPAISAGFLPLVLHFTSWQYPASIAFVTGVLAICSFAHRQILAGRIADVPRQPRLKPDEDRQNVGPHYERQVAFAGFVLLAYGLAVLTGMRLVLFPPLIVIAFEMFSHPDAGPWAGRPYALVAVCTLSAAAGFAAVSLMGTGPLSVAAALATGIVMLRIVRFHFPPALSIGLLPQVIAAPDVSFVAAVALGLIALTLTFAATRPYLTGKAWRSKLTRQSPDLPSSTESAASTAARAPIGPL